MQIGNKIQTLILVTTLKTKMKMMHQYLCNSSQVESRTTRDFLENHEWR